MTKTIALLTVLLLVSGCDLLGGDGSSGGEPDTGARAEDDTNRGGAGEGEGAVMAGITAAHNGYRLEEHDVPLVWSDEVAQYAQEWAEYLRDNHDCQLQHRSWLDMAERAYGENLYGSSVWGMALNTTPQAVVDAWWGEITDYDYASNTCAPDKVCGHYTQVMWEGSTEVGCGVAVCNAGENAQSDVWVCNYNPPGNYIGQKPW